MRKPAVVLALSVLLMSLTSVSVAAPVWLPGVNASSGWSDVNKTSVNGNPDSFLCWAASASNTLAWTHWWGWDSASSSYLDTAAEIYAQFQGPLWGNTIGSPIYGYEWWLTDRTESIIEDPPGSGNTAKVFDSTGRGFYPGVDVLEGASVIAFWQDNAYTALDTYVNAGRGTTIAIDIPNGPGTPGASYSHSLTVWGWDPDPAHMQIYVTDSDDGLTGLVTYSLLRSGNALTIVGYNNLYQSSTNVLISEVQRLNRNDQLIEPDRGSTNGGVVPEPTTALLLGGGLAGLLARRRPRS